MKKGDYTSIVLDALIEKLYRTMKAQEEEGNGCGNNKIVDACLDAVIVARNDYIFYNSTEQLKEMEV